MTFNSYVKKIRILNFVARVYVALILNKCIYIYIYHCVYSCAYLCSMTVLEKTGLFDCEFIAL